MITPQSYFQHIANTRKFTLTVAISSLVLGIAGCSSNKLANSPINSEELVAKSEQLNAREMALAKREAELKDREMSAKSAGFQHDALSSGDKELLPPNAQPGQCYARVWVEPTYQTRQEQVLVSEQSEKIEIIPAAYETVSETVLKKPETTKLVTIPPVYETITEQKLVKSGGTFWRTSLRDGAPVGEGVISAAEKAGIDVVGATPGSCYHEHFKPAKFVDEKERVLIKEASEKIMPVEAQYRWVEKQVLVSEASTRLEHIPAKYETVKEKVIDKPAHTVWKKGAGPIQKIDAATGEIMCLVEVPASYKTVTKQVLVSPAKTQSVNIPAQYKTVKVRELVSDATELREVIPAEYKEVSVRRKVSDPSFVWHEVHDNSMSAKSRTGRQICLVEEPAQYQSVTKRVVKTPAMVKKQIIPAEYETVSVEKLVRDAQEVKTVIPASYKTVEVKEVANDGKMEWRSILCETNMTRSRISDVQRALVREGYDPGTVDGVIGQQTMRAVNQFQRANNLPVDKYLNIDTLNALRVSAM